ncbi:rhomboid family intramembrane serine protease [Spirulina major CS-329]|uniref:rhomboid family intramembrane serine protease n=1 Tax=Spirulina TaxID=1154 RepID=UPI00232F90D5|nr:MULTISPECIES: rhomboid family intramembrane serine protease [Spirulina]MDB9495061.1 rhomboid family intramembrane serine protease [Spirulina subsalsa CS-330]MDB9504223.1 rhomboid family intramembrane serine protease [Spirulina major CS-329]
MLKTAVRALLARLPQPQTKGGACFACHQFVPQETTQCPHCRVSQPLLWGYSGPLQERGVDWGMTTVLIWSCVVVYGVSLAIDLPGIRHGGPMRWLSPSSRSLLALGSTGAVPLFELGRWWTVLSAAWLHGGALHLLLNLMWLRLLGPAVAQFYGAGRLLWIYGGSAIAGSVLTSAIAAADFAVLPPALHGANYTVGASGAIFGLLGALLSVPSPHLQRMAWTYALLNFGFGLFSVQVDNWAHLGGLLGGWFCSQLPGMGVKSPERFYHLIGAVIIGGGAIAAVLASILTPVG